MCFKFKRGGWVGGGFSRKHITPFICCLGVSCRERLYGDVSRLLNIMESVGASIVMLGNRKRRGKTQQRRLFPHVPTHFLETIKRVTAREETCMPCTQMLNQKSRTKTRLHTAQVVSYKCLTCHSSLPRNGNNTTFLAEISAAVSSTFSFQKL